MPLQRFLQNGEKEKRVSTKKGRLKNKEIKKLTVDELKNKVNLLKKDLFNFRFRKVNGQLEDTSKVSKMKKDIAKLLTELKKKG